MLGSDLNMLAPFFVGKVTSYIDQIVSTIVDHTWLNAVESSTV